ncbi:hypothetical protein [Mycolicibacterium canariasense]|uniref:hypothetical protein n=1 Tax=Mycolicibacterium canariasense TaxID=228230 RepID=UPI0010548954|nr:hypothetical protein [Mycolicibacterium canariasense]MCV7208365.1 hypothetical protein [Mycolicibacterium canariasense]
MSAQAAAEAAGPKPPSGRPPHLEPEAIAACTRCGPDGYRDGHICTHQDHAAAARHGKVRALEELRKAREARTEQ